VPDVVVVVNVVLVLAAAAAEFVADISVLRRRLGHPRKDEGKELPRHMEFADRTKPGLAAGRPDRLAELYEIAAFNGDIAAGVEPCAVVERRRAQQRADDAGVGERNRERRIRRRSERDSRTVPQFDRNRDSQGVAHMLEQSARGGQATISNWR